MKKLISANVRKKERVREREREEERENGIRKRLKVNILLWPFVGFYGLVKVF